MAALEEAGFRIFFSFLARDDLLRKRQFFAGHPMMRQCCASRSAVPSSSSAW